MATTTPHPVRTSLKYLQTSAANLRGYQEVTAITLLPEVWVVA